MKREVLTILLLLLLSCLKAQTFSEWFKQRKTQKKYLLEQIAALEVYSGYLQKGYEIARVGLNSVNSIRHNDFHLHNNHFQSFKILNPAINKLRDVRAITSLLSEMTTVSNNARKVIGESTWLAPGEASYLTEVFKNLLEKAKANTTLVVLLITPNKFQLADGERLERIQLVYKEMQEMAVFSRSFARGIYQLVLQRTKEQEQAESIIHLKNVEK